MSTPHQNLATLSKEAQAAIQADLKRWQFCYAHTKAMRSSTSTAAERREEESRIRVIIARSQGEDAEDLRRRFNHLKNKWKAKHVNRGQ